jgi:hypothetical protein
VRPTSATAASRFRTEVREGEWDVSEHHEVRVRCGHVVLDLRRARFPAEGDVEIHADVVIGSLQVVVGYGTRIVVDGRAIAGSFREHVSRFPPRLGPDSPTVRVTGVARLGSVDVGRIETARDVELRRTRTAH